jgi:tetratricopeptide (TPR) repeat protein
MTNATQSRWEELTDSGRRFLAQGDDAQAEAAYRAAVAEAERLGGDHTRLAASIECLAQLKYRQQALAEAESLFRRALALRDEAFGPEHVGAALTLNSLASLCSARGAHEEAEAFLSRALSAAERQGPAGHRELGATLNALARLHYKRGNYPAVEPLLLRLLALKQAHGREHPEVATVLTSLAALRSAIGRYDHAEQLLRRALAIREASPVPNVATIATLTAKLADAIAAQGRADEAAAIRSQIGAATPDDTAARRADDAHGVQMPHAPTPLRGLDIIALPDAAPRTVEGPAAVGHDGASLFAAAAALALDGFEAGTRPAPAPQNVDLPLWQPAEQLGAVAAPAAAPKAAKPATTRPRPAPATATATRSRLVSVTRGRLAAAALAAGIVLVAGKVTASSSRTEEATPPAPPAVADIAYPDEDPDDSFYREIPGEPQVAVSNVGNAEQTSAGIVDGGETSREAAARTAPASGERAARGRLARAPKLHIDMAKLDATVSARVEAATKDPIVELPAITAAGELPQVDGRRLGGSPPR